MKAMTKGKTFKTHNLNLAWQGGSTDAAKPSAEVSCTSLIILSFHSNPPPKQLERRLNCTSLVVKKRGSTENMEKMKRKREKNALGSTKPIVLTCKIYYVQHDSSERAVNKRLKDTHKRGI